MAMTHHLGPGALSDRNVEGETFESPRLPSPASAQLPLLHFETGSVLDVSVAGPDPEHLPHESTVYDYAYGDSDGYRYHREVSASTLEHSHTRVWGYPLSLALSPPQPNAGEYGALDRPPPRFRVCGRIYTDDARMKLGECIRRQCFNCGATETRTWRRSKLTLGKLVCNKCGLFERAHAIPRPKSFPPRRRSRPASVPQSRNPYPDIGGRHHNGTHSTMQFTGSPPSAHSGEGGEITATSQDAASWMMHNMADVSSVSSPVIPGHTDISTPTILLADFQLPSPHILHDQHALSHYPEHCFHPM